MHKLLVGVLFLAACGDDPAVKPDAAMQAQMDAPMMQPKMDAAVDAPPTVREGTVVVAELRGAMPDTTASASFQNSRLFGPPLGSAGGCDYYSNPDEKGVSAGMITITGGAQTITLTPTTTTPVDYPTPSNLPADLFDPADVLSVTAAGGTVPAFNGTVTAPAPIANPVLPASISRANPPTITWTAGTSNGMWLWIAAINGQTLDLVWCRMADNGSFAIPAAAVALIPTASTSAIVYLWRTNTSNVNAGGFAVSLVASDTFGTDIIAIQP